MILFRQLLLETGWTMQEFAQLIGVSRDTIQRIMVGIYGKGRPETQFKIEAAVSGDQEFQQWLAAGGYTTADIWNELSKAPASNAKPVGHGYRTAANKATPALVPGDPLELFNHQEAIMLSGRTLQHFKLFRDPFKDDIQGPRDIYMSTDHRFLQEMMLDTSRVGGFTAIIGDVGSGKSVTRKAVCHRLADEDIQIIYPIILDKARITPSSILDAVIMDISDEHPRRSLEQKSRQAFELLKVRRQSNLRQVLIIEEAHRLTITALKALKQLYEFEDGFTRLVGIILIGQTELRGMLDENNPRIREVARRVTRANIPGLNGDIRAYLEHKFKRHNLKVEKIFADDCWPAFKTKTSRPGRRGREISEAYPLTVNNLACRAMNEAAALGEDQVTAKIVLSV